MSVRSSQSVCGFKIYAQHCRESMSEISRQPDVTVISIAWKLLSQQFLFTQVIFCPCCVSDGDSRVYSYSFVVFHDSKFYKILNKRCNIYNLEEHKILNCLSKNILKSKMIFLGW